MGEGKDRGWDEQYNRGMGSPADGEGPGMGGGAERGGRTGRGARGGFYHNVMG